MLLLTRESLGLSIVWVRTVILTGRCYQVEHRLVTERWLESTATDTDCSLHDHHQPDNWRNHRFLLARIISSIKTKRQTSWVNDCWPRLQLRVENIREYLGSLVSTGAVVTCDQWACVVLSLVWHHLHYTTHPFRPPHPGLKIVQVAIWWLRSWRRGGYQNMLFRLEDNFSWCNFIIHIYVAAQ